MKKLKIKLCKWCDGTGSTERGLTNYCNRCMGFGYEDFPTLVEIVKKINEIIGEKDEL